MVHPGRSTEPVSAQAPREEGRRGRPGVPGIRSSPSCPAPQVRAPAVDSSRAADQMGITRGREADHSVLRGPSWLRKEVTSTL